MKKTFYFMAAAFLALSCEIDEPLPVNPVPGQSDMDGAQTVTAIVGVTLPGIATPSTKALAEEPGVGGITKLYAAVFDDAGYLTQYAEAECVDGFPTVGSDGNSETKKYRLVFNIGKTKPRIVHLIANGPPTVHFGSEEQVIASMTAHKNPDASKGEIGPDVYWNRVVLPDGITFDPEILDEHGNKTLVASSAEILRKVGLIRNFAKFTIQSNASNFELQSAKFLMTPDESYVAAYIKSTGEFVSAYGELSMAQLQQTGYAASAPATSHIIVDFTNPVPVGADGKISEFVFEREKPTSAPACIIVGGRYNGSPTTTYYKVNLVGDDGEYFPIMRNFDYTVSISTVASEGKATMEEAYESAGSGDISAAFGFEDLPKVSNGISSLQVQYTDRVLVTGDPFEFQYRFIPDISTGATNNRFIWCTEKPAEFNQGDGVYVYLGEAGDFGNAIQNVTLISDTGSEGRLRITPGTPSAVSKLQTLYFIGVTTIDGNKATIQRAVNIDVREKFSFSISCDPSTIENKPGTAVNLLLTIPAGLRQSLFPLEFQIESDQLSISPANGENLPVVTGKSIIDGNKPGYHFVKTITWAEYYHGDGFSVHLSDFTTVFTCRMVSNTADSSTGIVAANPYFNSASTSLTAAVLQPRFSDLSFSNDLYVGNESGHAGHMSLSRTTDFTYTDSYTTPVTVRITGADYEGTEMTSLGGGLYSYTPSAAGTQTITGIVANTPGSPVSITLSAAGYIPATATKYRYVTLSAGSFTSFLSPLSENPGVTSWSGDSGTGTVRAGTSVSDYRADVPVTVTRTLIAPAIAAPSVSGLYVYRSGSRGDRKYEYSGVISNYSSSCTYYYSTSGNSAKTQITLNAQHEFVIPNQTVQTLYLFAYDGYRYSNNTMCTYGSSRDEVVQGAILPEVVDYQCAGPLSDVKVEFNSPVSLTSPLVVYYGGTVGYQTTIGALY